MGNNVFSDRLRTELWNNNKYEWHDDKFISVR